jgi:hypothetical protein
VDDELRAEAMDYHVRQPFAVMLGLFFMPMDACDDGKGNNPSSFGSAVKKFRYRACRMSPSDSPELFERIYIGLFEPEGANRGSVLFFDVSQGPPKQGRPKSEQLLDLVELRDRILQTYHERNPPFLWADTGEVEAGEPPRS